MGLAGATLGTLKTWEPAASNDDAFIDEYLKLLEIDNVDSFDGFKEYISALLSVAKGLAG